MNFGYASSRLECGGIGWSADTDTPKSEGPITTLQGVWYLMKSCTVLHETLRHLMLVWAQLSNPITVP